MIQEIFGVNSHIRSVADRFAKEGHLAVAPALFQRVKPGVELGYTPAHPELEVQIYAAGHGFNCDQRASYNEAASALARERTLAFLARHLA